MTDHYVHLGRFSDWVAHSGAPAARTIRPEPGHVQAAIGRVLRPDPALDTPLDVRTERTWQRDGVRGEGLSWSVGFGPRTHAWLLVPQDASGPLPGVLALHGHDGAKFWGKEKVADGPDEVCDAVVRLRAQYYAGRAWANDLAREGFAVLVPDTFLWGSRRFDLADMPPVVQRLGELTAGIAPPDDVPGGLGDEVARYDAAAWHHENVVEKYCRLLGTTLAAVVAREDRIARAVLLARPEVSDAIGAVGLSGGGARAALLRATSEITAAVVVGMMSTYDALVDRDVVNHTWMLMPGDLPSHVDWPDVVASRAPGPLMVQYARGDEILPWPGAVAAHERIAEHYRAAGAPGAYVGHVVDGPHAFDGGMQRVAFDWLASRLR